jgi:hypothetical protein
MKVSLSYTVELDDVPEEVARLLSDTPNLNLEHTKRGLIELIRKKNTILAIQDIENLRKQLAILDRRLVDCQSILTGYTKHMASNTQSVPVSEPLPQYEDDGE